MINNNRIVPVTAIDLISLYGLILKTLGDGVFPVDAIDDKGDFQITSYTEGLLLASEPVATCDIDATASSLEAASIAFVPAYDYKGFSIDGETVETTGDEVDADGRTLYIADFADGAVAISKMGF